MEEINDAAGRLRRFIDRARDVDPSLTDARVADILDVSPATLSYWLTRKVVPTRGHHRRAIERWTSGAVREQDWETPEEREALQKIVPARLGVPGSAVRS